MGRVAVEPSGSVAAFLRRRREELGLSLREVESRVKALGKPIPFPTIQRVEKGRVDPGLRRLRALFRAYELPPRLLDDLLDLEEFSGEWPTIQDPAALYLEGVRLWKRGDIRCALAHLCALRTQTPGDEVGRYERQKGLLSFAVMVGAVGKFHLSKQIIEDLLLEPPVETLLVPILVQAGACWHSLGSGIVALGLLSQAEARLTEGDHRGRAWVAHQCASVLRSLGRHEDSEAQVKRAREAYRQAGDAHGESRLYAVRFELAFERDLSRALVVAREGREHAERHRYKRLVVMRRIEEGRALLALGDETAGRATLSVAVADAIAAEDDAMQFYAHFYLWKSHVAAKNAAQAAIALQAAQHFAGHVDESTPEVKEIRGVSLVRRSRQRETRASRRAN